METITFECETITPMFMAGADGVTPELRAPSIKGALRFWWRAMNGDKDLATLKKLEGEIFGNTDHRSKVIIIASEIVRSIGNNEMLPHKENSTHRSPKTSFNRKFTFSVKFILPSIIKLSDGSTFSFLQLKTLFILMTTLGGLGKRSRRGMGSIKILKEKMPITNEEIMLMIKIVNPNFSFHSNSNYPTIHKIEIGKAKKTPTNIGKATHAEKLLDMSTYKSIYESTIGGGKPRFASPIYISVLQNDLPIITTLNTISPKPMNLKLEIQESLKEMILQ